MKPLVLQLYVYTIRGVLQNMCVCVQETSTDSAECQDTVASKVSNFSTLCSNIPSQLSNEMRRNISVPICFVCLLHLANEKVLSKLVMFGLLHPFAC